MNQVFFIYTNEKLIKSRRIFLQKCPLNFKMIKTSLELKICKTLLLSVRQIWRGQEEIHFRPNLEDIRHITRPNPRPQCSATSAADMALLTVTGWLFHRLGPTLFFFFFFSFLPSLSELLPAHHCPTTFFIPSPVAFTFL